MDVDQAIRYLEKEYPGLKVKNFIEDIQNDDPKGMYEMDLEINGKSHHIIGHLKDFQKINKELVQKFKNKINEKSK
jgi:hypothetical protein